MIEQETLESLKSKIAVLVEENNTLSQNAEDLFLVSTLFDTIQKEGERSLLFQNVLEKVAVLKNIPYCALLTKSDSSFRLISEYLISQNLNTLERTFEINNIDFSSYRYEPLLISTEEIDSVQKQLGIDKYGFLSKEIVLIPFYSKLTGQAFLLCATNQNSTSLSKIVAYLVYIVNRIAERFDSIYYQSELQRLNHDLEGRIIERTNELLELNKQLKLEVEERKKKEELIKQHYEELSIINHLINSISFSTSIDDICKAAIEHLVGTIQLDVVFIFIREENSLVLKYSQTKSGAEALTSFREHRVGECMCGLAVARNKALYSKNIFEDRRCTWEECKKNGFKSFAALPLRNGDEVIGVIGISSKEEVDYEIKAKFLETLSAEIAMAFVQAEAHEKLALSENRMRVIVEGTPNLFFYTQNMDADVTYISPTVYNITGYTAEQWLNQRHWFVTNSLLNNEAKRRTREHLTGKYLNDPIFVEIKHALGYPILLEVYENPVIMDGKVIGLQGVAHDVTERKLAQDRLASQNIELISALEKAKQIDRLKTIFFANMSHELRTPLVGMLGYSDLLKEELIGDEKEMASKIYISGKRLLHTLNQILNYSEIESGSVELLITSVNINELLDDELELYKIVAKQKGITLSNEYQSESVIINSDEKLLQSVFSNLINNAIKYTDSGTVSIIVEAIDDSIIIKVRDTGIGIPEAKFELIFEEFRQISEGVSRQFDGTGLGLAITKKYILLLGGQISLDSEIGKGTTFTVRLPKNSSIKK
ncbi:MAG: ATP-binding protein [Melioribacteraceae bacterium]